MGKRRLLCFKAADCDLSINVVHNAFNFIA